MKRDLFTLPLNFDGLDLANDSGVYADCERLEFCQKKLNCRVEIRIANTAYGYLWGVCAYFRDGGFGYMPNNRDAKTAQPTRDAALKCACNELLDRISTRNRRPVREAAAVLSWTHQIAEAA